jgi:hypothetical protein
LSDGWVAANALRLSWKSSEKAATIGIIRQRG